MKVLIQTACYNCLDGVSETIRKIELHLLLSDPTAEVCVLTTSSGNPSNSSVVLDKIKDEATREDARRRRKVMYVTPLKLPVMDMYDYCLGFRLYPKDREAIRKWNPDVIHTTVPDLLNLDLVNVARRNGTPVVSTFHSNYVKYMDYYEARWIKVVLEHWMRHMFSFIPILFVPTLFYKQLLSSPSYHLDKCVEIKVWSRGVDTEVFKPGVGGGFRSRWGFDKDDVIVTFVGRLVVEKSPGIFIEVLKRLRANGVKCKGLLVGEGTFKDVAEREAGGIVTTTGWLKGHELVAAYASSDVFLFPSGCETFGNVTLEACSCGLPIVVEQGCSSHLVDGNGFAVKPNDVDEFYNKTKMLIEDRELRVKMGKQSREKVAMMYKIDAVMDRMVDIYKEAIETQVGEKASRVPRFPDNKYNFPWGRTEHPSVLLFIEGVFWIVVTSCVKLVQLYTFLNKFEAFRWIVGLLKYVVVKAGWGGLNGWKGGKGGGQERAQNYVGNILAWCILSPLAAKRPIFGSDRKHKKLD